MSSSQAVYCLSLQIQPNGENGNTAKPTNSNKNEAATMQQVQQQQQKQQQQQPLQQQPPVQQQQLTNNIILLRGSRNENGQIIIQNKHDIISFINEQQQQQQQQQQQHDKTTAATLATQLPTTTTIARKIHTTGNAAVASAVVTTATSATSNNNAKDATTATASNTILLQTPINASQLESVLLQSSQHLKKSAALNERSFLIKNSSRSLSTDSNRLSSVDSKGPPFVLQTLKRLEKSQSILVIRNSTAASSSASSATASSSNVHNNIDAIATSALLPTTATVSTNTGSTPAALFNNSSTSLSFTRASKNQQQQQQQQTRLANIIANRTTTTAATLTSTTGTASSALSSTLSSIKSSTSNIGAATTTTTTTFLRLGSNTTVAAAAAAFANKCKNNNKANSNNYNNQRNNRVILNGATTTTTHVEQQKLSLADVQQQQQQHERTASSASTAVAAGQQQQQQQNNVPLGSDGEPIKLPDNLESLPRADSFPSQRHRWNTNEEIAAILISFDKHNEWQSKEVRTRPKSGSLLLYSRKKVRYRRDGYCWKKRKDGKTTREDHMKLKVQGTECIYGCYVHSAILPTFHRRCYWLLQNPDIVLVHYLNVPYPDDNKMAVIAPSITLWGDKKEWTKEELVSQLKPMLSSVTSDDDSDSGNDIEISTAETVESIVCQLMEKQRLSRQAALVKQLDCGCADSSCVDGKSCSHPVMRRTGLLKSVSAADKRATLSDGYNQSTTATPNVVIGPKLYARWSDRRTREANIDHYQQQQHHPHQQLTQEGAIKFQIIQPQHNEQQQHHTTYQQQQQHYRQHNHNNNNSHHQLLLNRNNLIIQQQQQQQQQHTNFNQVAVAAAAAANNQSNQINLQRFVANHNGNNNTNNNLQINNNRLQIAKTTITATNATAMTTEGAATADMIATQNHTSANSNNNKMHRSSSNQLTLAPQQQQQQQHQNSNTNAINNNSNNNNSSSNYNFNASVSTHTSAQQQKQQELYKMQLQHKQSTATTTTDSKVSFQLTQQQQQQQRATHVQPMCMSPEHQPSTPTHGNNNNINHPLLLQSNSNTSTSSSTSSSSSSSSTSNSVPSPAASNVAVAAGESSVIIDDNVVNQQQLATTIKTENLISSNDNQICSIAVDSNNDAATAKTELSTLDANSSNSGCNSQQQSSTATSNSNTTDYTNNTNGCQPLSASHENSNSTNDESIETNPELLDNNSHHTIGFETMETNIDGTASNETHVVASAAELHDTLSFFNETLDLSQEDIQRTLIANLPFDAATGDAAEPVAKQHVDHVAAAQLVANAMHYMVNNSNNIDNNINHNHVDDNALANDETDDVFVNLDAFDMLVEFPDLDLDDKQALSHASLEQATAAVQLNYNEASYDAGIVEKQPLPSLSHCNRKLLSICDFSPEWSYPEGGVKVLVAGPWTNSSATYTVLFDSLPVPTLLVQQGVLRCYCPAHEVGFATLQVSCDGYVVSNSVMFEYKVSPGAEAAFDGSSNDCLYKFTLLNRLTAIDEKMRIKTENGGGSSLSAYSQSNFEEKLVSYCHQLKQGTWRSNNSSWSSGFRGMSLLHLAAALGYAKLVCAMLNWRAENPNIILETEIDALSQDVHGYTPMTWACARGHIDTALLLYKWNKNALKLKNHAQQTALDVASLKGHKTLVSEIYRLEYERNKLGNNNNSSLSSLSLNLNKYDLSDKNHNKIAANTTDDLYDEKLGDHLLFQAGLEGAFDAPRSHDGVFLRPVPVASNQSPPNYSRFSKRSSVDSGINMDIRGKPGKASKDMTRLQSFDAHDSYSLSSESPLDTFNTTNATNSLLSPLRKMDFALCEVSTGDSSPLPAKEHDDASTLNNDDTIADVVINSETDGGVGDSDAKVLTLAEHIIAAMPERIKNEADEMMVLGSPMTEPLNSESNGLNDSFMDPLLDSLPNTHFDSEFSLDFNEHSYRYHDVSTPCSSLSPASSGPLQSPASYSLLGVDPSVNSPSPPPSTKQLTEFLHASSNNQCPFEADFSRLTLTDSEQRELYEAAKCIQKAYRSYKGRQKLEEQNKERSAAIVIQNYYRRYKQYAYYRQMTNAALVIQHGYRSYCRNKRFKKSTTTSMTSTTAPNSAGSSASNNSNSQCLSSFYDHYKNDQQQDLLSSQPSTPKETSPSGPLKRTYSQSTQNQAARKIQQFMRQSRIKLQKERAEKEKLVHQRREEYLRSLQCREQKETACNPEPSETEQMEQQ